MNLEIVILAAGKGSRMKSQLPKVLHPVAGRPMLQRVVDTARALSPRAVHVVVGHGAEDVMQAVDDAAINWVTQTEQKGTGHAVLQALPHIGSDSTVLVLYGDVPLIRAETLSELVSAATTAPAVLTARVASPAGLGRILRDNTGKLLSVVEHKDASQAELAIDEINTGVMAVPAVDLQAYLPRVGNENAQGEYYLPDVLSLAVADGRAVASCIASSELEVLGVNDRVQLNRVEREFQRRRGEALLLEGVAVADVSRLDIRGELVCGHDVFIDVNVVFEGVVKLGDGVKVGPNCVVKNTTVEAGAHIHAMSHLEDVSVGAEANVGPYARLRPGTELAAGARVGNFVETKKAKIGAGSKINHLSYVGDCEMGAGVNIGAGTITCNYDGVNKHKTSMGDGVFVGSNSTLVAPLSIEDGGFIGAGSTVTRAVAADELAVSRAKQRNIQGWKRPTKAGGDE
ncbi:UDP-N-acetylglucosamine diphosphorylase/glucosamine-1-phosphate N-acetyltransferase [Halioglobus maricola]|uniref:Bifunctional protein GlmU n=1 Tax=Halioglobus maricola TaxID=2601894 RepID=A0A5P9NQC8_9GAMM|nr:bifunctional UDP-N-acetylglucosamine diphosphorylase/glucosamine-1-phosphate N-acetyltransferase GlmU [Halioglobus maricola]QFU77655.1 UDP-N-acetylglucosamine diphosphorylase/glucosamine-1-phosphate N-acetyltransferase [Halioglobus maricola]